MSLKCTMVLGDCLEVMPSLSGRNVAMAFLDVPFGVTNNNWDVKINTDELWAGIRNACKSDAAFIWAATMPFGADIINSNRKWFRYDLVWTKTSATGFLNANKMPLRAHESLLVFYKKLPVYNPQKTARTSVSKTVRRSANLDKGSWISADQVRPPWLDDGFRHPFSCIPCGSNRKQSSLHPTQKPIALMDWLIKSYSNPGDSVFDPVSGSFTTCVSACQNKRHSVGIEKDPTYFEIGVERVRKHVRDNNLDVKIEVRR